MCINVMQGSDADFGVCVADEADRLCETDHGDATSFSGDAGVRSEGGAVVSGGLDLAMTGRGDQEMACRLVVELVPEFCPRLKLSVELDRGDWQRVERSVLDRAGNRCEICDNADADADLTPEASWSYDDSAGRQRFERLLAVCAACSEVIHIDLAAVSGDADRAVRHLATVNAWNEIDAEQHVAAAYRRWQDRSRHVWTTDLSRLREYGLEPAHHPRS